MVQLDGFYVLGTFLTAAQISLQGYHLSLKFLPLNFNERRVTDDLFVCDVKLLCFTVCVGLFLEGGGGLHIYLFFVFI